MSSGNTDAAELLRAMRSFLKENDMMAYVDNAGYPAHRTTAGSETTGTLYLHCDPTASHYLKLLLDAVFAPQHFLNEIIWQRTNARSTIGRWPRIHDVLLFYAKSEEFTYHPTEILVGGAKLPHTLITGIDRQKYQTYELTAPGLTKLGESGKPWRGFDPSKYGRHWANSQATMEAWDKVGQMHWPKKGGAGGFPRRLAENPFVVSERTAIMGDVWTDVDRLDQTAKERLGYQTQKPVPLLERIITSSSDEEDTVLDPFCGCGTTIHAAQKLNRRWIGIDVTHLAISLIEKRLNDAFPGIEYEVHGTPKDLEGARDLALRDKYQFQWWAVSLVNAVPFGGKKKGADSGIDGIIYFKNFKDGKPVTEKIIVSVKGGENVSVGMVRDLVGVVDRENAKMGLFVTLAPPTDPMNKEAVTAGFYQAPNGKDQFRKIQIATIEDLLEGKKPDLPPQDPSAFLQAPREDDSEQLALIGGGSAIKPSRKKRR